MKKLPLRILLSGGGIVLFTVLCIGMTQSLGWFDNRIDSPVKLEGRSASSYFYAGDGTADNPYIITNRRHVYNLAWLQYIGEFNKKDSSGKLVPVYFKVASTDKVSSGTIDCSGLTIPPIGTSQYPFIGVFNGNNSEIKNLIVTDDMDNMTSAPTAIKGNTEYVESNKLKHCSVIGFFGIVGGYSDTMKDLEIYENITDSVGLVDGKIVTSVSDIYLDQVTIRPKTGKALAGILAGYVNGNLSSCGAYRSKLDFNSGTTNLNSKFGKVSDYSLVGSYNKESVSWEDAPGGGDDVGFGGSIDMKTLNRRINYMATNSTINKDYSYLMFNNSYFHLNALNYLNANGYKNFYWNTKWNSPSDNDNLFMYLLENTVLPLNVDKLKMGLDSEVEKTVKKYIGSKQFDLYTNDQYVQCANGKTPEDVAYSNTGFIVGGGSKTDGSDAAFRSRICTIKRIYRSYREGDEKRENFDSFMDDFKMNLQLLTYDSQSNNKNWVRIKDVDNQNVTKDNTNSELRDYDRKTPKELGYKHYENVKSGFIDMLGDGKAMHGIGFSKFLKPELNNLETCSLKDVSIADGKTEGNKISTYTNYQLLEGAINFSLAEPGELTTVVGTYFKESGNPTKEDYNRHSLFSLFNLKRDTSGAITKITEVDKVYSDGNGNYSFDNSDGKKKVTFDSSLFSGKGYLPNNRTAYYFEFGLPKGEYAIGVKTSSYVGSYMMYLDIGANANGETPSKEGSISKLDFTYVKDGSVQKIRSFANGSWSENQEYLFSNVLFSLSETSLDQVFIFIRYAEQADSDLKVVYWNSALQGGLSIQTLGDGKSSLSASSLEPMFSQTI